MAYKPIDDAELDLILERLKPPKLVRQNANNPNALPPQPNSVPDNTAKEAREEARRLKKNAYQRERRAKMLQIQPEVERRATTSRAMHQEEVSTDSSDTDSLTDEE